MDIKDFFSSREVNEPFTSGMENTVAYLRWYDMFLTAALEKSEDAESTRRILREAAGILSSREKASAGRQVSDEYGISLSNIAAEFQLQGYPFFCLLMAISQDMDGNYRSSYRDVSSDGDESDGPTFSFAEELYALACEELDNLEIGKYGNLIRQCPLFTIYDAKAGTGSLKDSFEANRQLISLLKGDYTMGKELSLVCDENVAVMEDEGPIVHVLEHKRLSSYLTGDEWYEIDMDIDGEVIQIAGDEGSGRKNLILESLQEGTSVMTVDLHRLTLLEKEVLQQVLAEIQVRARILKEEVILVKRADVSVGVLETIIIKLLKNLRRIYVVTNKNCLIDAAGIKVKLFKLTLEVPRSLEQVRFWEKELSKVETAEDVKARDFGGMYKLLPGTIHSCVQSALSMALSKGRDLVTKEDITEAVLLNTTTGLDVLSDRMPLRFGWDDLVVDERQKEIMFTLCSRVKNRSLVDEEWGFEEKLPYGRGVSMLLYGSPGTGKTMAAQVMAKEIGMALYRVDLSQLVDKYIGETEKNLGKIFDAARDGNVILFFDEADALFSKRTEVQTSNDKHANTEVAYLLQKIEQHDGVTFLATNRFNDFDNAFLRRITYAVRIGKPGPEERLKMFENILPEKAPREKDLDLEFFAQTFELSGSEIKEILYSAAFIAAKEGRKLGNQHIARAIKYQQEKTGKLMNGSEFGKYTII